MINRSTPSRLSNLIDGSYRVGSGFLQRADPHSASHLLLELGKVMLRCPSIGLDDTLTECALVITHG